MPSSSSPKHDSQRIIEIDTLEQFDALTRPRRPGAPPKSPNAQGWHVGPIDLRARAQILGSMNLKGTLFLGTLLPEGFEDDAREQGALVFPALEDIPFDAYRAEFYSPQQLYAGLMPASAQGGQENQGLGSYEKTLDARVYQWFRSISGGSAAAELAMSIHDYSMTEALQEHTNPQLYVGVMGGHAAQRGTEDYAQAALLASMLYAQGFAIATGGGPGAMEAANLGAYLAPTMKDVQSEGQQASVTVLDRALERLAQVPHFTPDISAWARAGFEVLDGVGLGENGSDLKITTPGESLGIPTWFYGHEPPNVFATQIAKYFANSQREAILLQYCTGGIVFLPGAGGTVQEIFQDACENYYAADERAVNPMVLVGKEYWTQTMPAWPLLQALARQRRMKEAIFLVDTAEEALEVLKDYRRKESGIAPL